VTIDPLLQKALDTLHSIGGAYLARRILLDTSRKLTEPLRESMQAKALTDEAIENLALDTWEEIVTAIHEARHE
jgi:predicted ArsR family transcriptional regulator